MKYFLILLSAFFILGCCTLNKPLPSENNSVLESTYNFPEDWLGSYTGTLEAYRAGSDQNLYPADVELTIAETPDSNRWQWSSVYHIEGQEDPVEKKYYIIQPDTLAANQFIMDEDNGIFINQHRYGNTITGAYTVNKQFFTFSYTKVGNELLYELTVYNREPKEALEIEEGFEVGKVEMTNVQRVYFTKVEK